MAFAITISLLFIVLVIVRAAFRDKSKRDEAKSSASFASVWLPFILCVVPVVVSAVLIGFGPTLSPNWPSFLEAVWVAFLVLYLGSFIVAPNSLFSNVLGALVLLLGLFVLLLSVLGVAALVLNFFGVLLDKITPA